MHILIRGAAVAAALFLGGCITVPPEVPFDRATDANIHSVGVLTPDLPDKPTVRLASDIGQSFGLIGALVDASMEANRDDKLWAMMQEQNFVPVDAFDQDLVGALKAQGFDASFVSVERDRNGVVKSYPADRKFDAYLDITGIGIAYGYMAAGVGSSNPYRPFVYVHCKLIRAGDGATLMEDTIMYNAVNGAPKAVTLSPDPQFQFPDMDSMDGDHKKAVAGVDAALHQSADMIGTLLK
ncbi:MAG: hypothetical protein ACREHE_14545 [Rhizomicrobium sp.]